MVAADTIVREENADPTSEVLKLTVTDGETYTSRKFGTVTMGQATLNVDSGALTIPIGLAISGAVVTIHGTGLSDHVVCLTLYGRK